MHLYRYNALSINAKLPQYITLKREGDTSTQSGKSLKLVNKFTYLDSNNSFTENDVNIRLATV